MNDAGIVLLYAVLHMALVAAPGAAAIVVAGCRGVRDVVTLLAIGMVASGASAMLAFWAYFGAHGLGLLASFTIPAASVIVVCWGRARLGRQFPWGRLAFPVTLWAFGTLFLLFLGFLHGGVEHPIQTASVRFSHHLPSDNWLPMYFSESIYKFGHTRVPPHAGSWLSSDRPPLQMGYVLAARPFGSWTSGLHYQVLGVALQQLWIVGMWALLEAARVRVRTRALILTAALVSDIAIVHGFFIWPKLVAVGFLLTAAAFIVGDRWTTTRRTPGMAVLLAGLFALAMLCHGTSFYCVIPLVLIAARRGRPARRWIVAGLLAGTALYVPWLVYQHYFDPPGNRLFKTQLAAHDHVDHQTVLASIVDAYSEIGVGKALDNKIHNVDEITGGARGVENIGHAIRAAAKGHFHDAIATARAVRFYSLLQSLAVLAFAPVLILVLRRRRRVRSATDWTFAGMCFVLVAVACALWIVVQFGTYGTDTIIHTGSLAVPMLAIIGCVAGLAAMSTRLAAIFVGVNALLVLAIYTPALSPLPGGTRFSYVFAAGAVAFLTGFVVAALHPPQNASGPPVTTASRAPGDLRRPPVRSPGG
jgi:hypothetical protein